MAYNILNPPTITIPEDNWSQLGYPDPFTHLTTHIRIGDTDIHIEAIQVYYDEDTSLQHTTDKNLEQMLDEWSVAAAADGPYQTYTAFDRNYVLFASPYC